MSIPSLDFSPIACYNALLSMTTPDRLPYSPPEAIAPKMFLDFSAVPTEPEARERTADFVASRLIVQPRLIPSFFQQIDEAMGEAQSQNAQAQTDQIQQFTGMIAESVGRFDWTSRREDPFSVESAQTLLLYLPKPDEQPTAQQTAVERITKGYLQDRFEAKDPKNPKDIPDWRGALRAAHTFLEAATIPQADFQMLNTYFDLLIGKYPQIAGINSVVRHGLFLGHRAAAPNDERNIELSSEVGQSLDLIAEYFGRENEFQEYFDQYEWLNAKFDIIQFAVFELHRTGKRIILPSTIETIYKDTLRQFNRRPQENRRYMRPGINYKELAKEPMPLDFVHTALHNGPYETRFFQLNQAISGEYERRQNRTDVLEQQNVHLRGSGQTLDFPQKHIYHAAEPIGKIYGLFGEKQRTTSMKRNVDARATTRGKNYETLQFTHDGLRGYIIWKKNDGLSSDEKTQMIHELIQQHGIKDLWEKRVATIGDPTISGITMSTAEVDFVIAKEQWIDKSGLETFLDETIAEEVLENSVGYLKANTDLRQDLPSRFRRVPTRAGDYYRLADHPQLPGVIRDIRLQRRDDGTLGFTMGFATDELIEPLQGTINFSSLRTNINFASGSPVISSDQQWILESALLKVIESSCCPPFEEIEKEKSEFEKQAVGKRLPGMPGYFARIGVRRADGSWGQPTEYAKQNHQDAMRALWKDVNDISLANILARYREEHPQDPRFITYNKGYENPDVEQVPFERDAPIHILPTPLPAAA